MGKHSPVWDWRHLALVTCSVRCSRPLAVDVVSGFGPLVETEKVEMEPCRPIHTGKLPLWQLVPQVSPWWLCTRGAHYMSGKTLGGTWGRLTGDDSALLRYFLPGISYAPVAVPVTDDGF